MDTAGHPAPAGRAHVSRTLTDLGIDAGLMGRTHHGCERAEIIQPEWIGLIVECIDSFKHVGGREAADHVLHRIAFIDIGAVLISRIVAVNPTSSDVLPPDDVPQMPRRSGSTCH